MIRPSRFVLRTLTAFALLLTLGWATNAAGRYASLVEHAVRVAGPVTSGWWLEERVASDKRELWLRKETAALRLQLSPDHLALAIYPLLSLILGTPGIRPRRAALASVIGVSGLFTLDTTILLLYPALVLNPGPAAEILGFFLGLLTFVGGPMILWFALTYPELRALWALNQPEARP